MKLFDTHCHFETEDDDEIAAILSRARAAGVARLVAVGGSEALNAAARRAARVARERPDESPQVACALGYDRDQIDAARPPVDADGDLVAWGEIGLDYHYAPESRKGQVRLFAEQLEEARKRRLPVVVHTREADDDTLGLLREIPSFGVIHCYTGAPAFARRLLDLGFLISFSGIATFRSAQTVRDSARYVPDDLLLIETDAPYLAPVPVRGRPNEPAFIVHTCRFLAELRNVAPDDLAARTYRNAERLLDGAGGRPA